MASFEWSSPLSLLSYTNGWHNRKDILIANKVMIYTMKLIFQSQSPTNILQLVFLGLNLNNNLHCQAQHQLQLSRPGQDSILVLGSDAQTSRTIFFCQTQFKVSTSSVRFELRLTLSLIITTPTPTHHIASATNPPHSLRNQPTHPGKYRCRLKVTIDGQ